MFPGASRKSTEKCQIGPTLLLIPFATKTLPTRKIYFRIIFRLPFHYFDFFELILENHPVPIAFVWVVWHYPFGTPVLVEFIFYYRYPIWIFPNELGNVFVANGIHGASQGNLGAAKVLQRGLSVDLSVKPLDAGLWQPNLWGLRMLPSASTINTKIFAGDAQSRRKRTSTHEWVHEWHHEWAHEWTHKCAHEIAHESAHDRTYEGWFPLFQVSRTPTKRPTKASTEVPMKMSSQVVEVHLSCFHLFCLSAISQNKQTILWGINFVKITKIYFPALIQNLATLVWFLCNIHASPRGAHGSYTKKIGAAMKPRKNYKNIYKKTGGELICKNSGRMVMGPLALSLLDSLCAQLVRVLVHSFHLVLRGCLSLKSDNNDNSRDHNINHNKK